MHNLSRRLIQSKPRITYETGSCEALLRRNGLDTPDRVFALIENSIHDHDGRAVSKVLLQRPNDQVISAFVKMNWGRRRLIPRVRDLRSRQAFTSLPQREWEGLGIFRRLGLRVPNRFALLQQGNFWFREAVIIEKVPPEFSVDDWVRNGTWDSLSSQAQTSLLESMVGVMQRIHHAGYGWRGTCTRHFFPVQNGDETWSFWLIDCEGVHACLDFRAVQNDYRKLAKALRISGMKPRTLELFSRMAKSAEQRWLSAQPPLLRRLFPPAIEPTLHPSA